MLLLCLLTYVNAKQKEWLCAAQHNTELIAWVAFLHSAPSALA